MNLRYDRVALDVGGTMVGFYDWQPFQAFLASVGLPASEADARAFHRQVTAAIGAARGSAQGLGAHEQELFDWWAGIFHRVWPERPDLADDMTAWLRAGRFDRVFPDVEPALEALRALGLPLAIVSNFGSNLEVVLARQGLRAHFDIVIASAMAGVAKPDRRIFDLLVARAGLPGARLLYVGDHVGDDIEGAQGAGLDAVLIDRRNHQPEARCARIGSLTDLIPYVQSPQRPGRAVLLDMDGVVLDSMPAHLLSWQRTLAPLGIDLTADDLYPLEGVPTELTAQRLTEQLLGKAVSDDAAWRLRQTKQALFREIFEPAAVPGMIPLLYDLSGRGYRLGLVTGSARRVVDENLAPLGLDGLFETIVSGDDVQHGKPDAEPYRTAANRLATPPEACLVVENAPLGIRAARAAGMRCVALQTTLPAEELAGAETVFTDVEALRAWTLREWSAVE